MPRDTHGGFDQVVEISRWFFAEQAGSQLSMGAQDLASGPSDAYRFLGQVRPELRDVWFGDAGEVFDPATGQWGAAGRVAAFNAIAFTLDINGFINVESLPVQTQQGTIDLPVPDTVRRLNVHLGVAFLAPLSTEMLAVRDARDQRFPEQRTWCAVVLLPAATFFYNVRPDMRAIRESPFTIWAIDAVRTFQLGDPEVVVVRAVEQLLRERTTQQLSQTLAATCDWHLDRPGRIGLVTTSLEMGVTAMDTVTTFNSIRVLMQTTGSGGQRQLAVRSQLNPASATGDADALVVTVNGRYLVEQLRRPLTEAFPGLALSDFLPGEPCTVNSPVSVTLAGRTYTLLYLQAGINESSRLLLWLFLRASLTLATIDVEIELPIAFTAERAVRRARQELLIIPRVQRAEYAVSAATVPVVHWIVEAVAAGMVGTALRGPFNFTPQTVPTPQGVFADVNGLSLRQAGAPRELRTWPGMRLIGGGFNVGVVSDPPGLYPGRFRDHDLVLHVSATRYPQPLEVSCVEPDTTDELRRIDGLGGTVDALGAAWGMPVDAAIDWIASGGTMTSGGARVILGRQPDDCPPDNPDTRRIPYLRTTQDDDTTNNLAAQPFCSPPITIYSDTFVHWSDYVESASGEIFGRAAEGTDLVNEGAQVGASCTVTQAALELVRRDEGSGEVIVVATYLFGGPEATYEGARAAMETDPIGTRNLEIRVHWWCDANSAISYRLRYTLEGACP
jgi:hypothetical protein